VSQHVRPAPCLRGSGASRWGSSPGGDSPSSCLRVARGWRPRGGVLRPPEGTVALGLQVQDKAKVA